MFFQTCNLPHQSVTYLNSKHEELFEGNDHGEIIVIIHRWRMIIHSEFIQLKTQITVLKYVFLPSTCTYNEFVGSATSLRRYSIPQSDTMARNRWYRPTCWPACKCLRFWNRYDFPTFRDNQEFSLIQSLLEIHSLIDRRHTPVTFWRRPEKQND